MQDNEIGGIPNILRFLKKVELYHLIKYSKTIKVCTSNLRNKKEEGIVMSEPIGGFFELELSRQRDHFIHDEAYKLNSGRNALKFLLGSQTINKVYVPNYMCNVIFDSIDELGIDISYYHVNEHLEPEEIIELEDEERLIYINYFGLKDNYIRSLNDKKIIIDNSHSFFSKPRKGFDTFYSPRKFFGLPDGGLLYSDIDVLSYEKLNYDISYNRFDHLLKRIDIGPERSYNAYLNNMNTLVGLPIRRMSKLTEKIMESIDYEYVKKKRLENFSILNEALQEFNEIKLDLNTINIECPMIYPFQFDNKLRKYLIGQKIFVAQYWPELINNTCKSLGERKLIFSMSPLPIDQRYGANEMDRIIRTIKKYLRL